MNTGQIYYRILTSNNDYQSSQNDIFDVDLVPNNSVITKISITAEPGTQVNINNGKIIMIGRTGVYEAEDVEINHLQFIRPVRYNLNSSASKKERTDGITGIKDKYTSIKTQIEVIGNNDGSEAMPELLDATNQIKSDADELITFCNQYINGHYGVYDQDPIAGDLQNVIVDYVYKAKGGA